MSVTLLDLLPADNKPECIERVYCRIKQKGSKGGLAMKKQPGDAMRIYLAL